MKERRYFELNGLKVEPRFAEKPLYTVCDTWLQVTDKIPKHAEIEIITLQILNQGPFKLATLLDCVCGRFETICVKEWVFHY